MFLFPFPVPRAAKPIPVSKPLPPPIRFGCGAGDCLCCSWPPAFALSRLIGTICGNAAADEGVARFGDSEGCGRLIPAFGDPCLVLLLPNDVGGQESSKSEESL